MRLILLICILLAGCNATFEKHNAGTVQLWIGNQEAVEQECVKRGVSEPPDVRIYGCTDFKAAVIVSVEDPAVIAHEWCHWTRWTASHLLCPTPIQ